MALPWWGRHLSPASKASTLLVPHLPRSQGSTVRDPQQLEFKIKVGDSMDLSLSKLREIVKDREAWHASRVRKDSNKTLQLNKRELKARCPLHVSLRRSAWDPEDSVIP